MSRPARVPDWAKTWLEWNTYQIAKDQADYLIEEGAFADWDKAFEDACGDSDIIDWEWQDITYCLSDWMKEMFPDCYRWRAEVANFGWRHQSGYKDFEAEDGEELLHAVLPNTDCTYYIYPSKDGNALEINNSHHDAPTGGEMYYIYPRPEEDDDEAN